MTIIEHAELSAEQESRIVELWNAEYPISLVYTSVEKFGDYLDGLTAKRHFLLIDSAGIINGWAMTFEREDARWFVIIIDGTFQGIGLGAKLIDRLKKTEDHLFGWVIDHSKGRKLNGERYVSPLGFYTRNGFRVLEDERIESDKMSGVKIVWTGAQASRLP